MRFYTFCESNSIFTACISGILLRGNRQFDNVLLRVVHRERRVVRHELILESVRRQRLLFEIVKVLVLQRRLRRDALGRIVD